MSEKQEIPSCLDCAWKHIAQAMIINEEEMPLGYPDYIIRVIGHLAEASREAVGRYQAFGEALRGHRTRLMSDPLYRVPYREIASYIAILRACEAEGITIPDVPVDIMPGAVESAPEDTPH